MKKLILFVCFYVSFLSVDAQSAEDSVRNVIDKLFMAMKNSDGNTLKECFADSAILQTITSNGGIRNESVIDFVRQIGSLPKDSADERITYDVIRIDNGLAIAWTPYQFYYAGKFSHCGVNSFQLVRQNGLWKIQYLIDTRRRINCK